MTKAEERKVLEQIKTLIESTGADSYISAAFDGCIELATENIDNDYMFSFPDKLDGLRIRAQNDAQEAKTAKALLEDERKGSKDIIKTQQDTINKLRENERINAASYRELETKAEIQKSAIEKLENEVIRLKAKLYDLMTAEN